MGRLPPSHVDDPVALGLRIQSLRNARGLSLGQIAFPGCSASFLSRVESGDRVPALVTLRELASRLGVSIEELIGSPLDGTGRVSEGTLGTAETAERMGDSAAASQIDAVLEQAPGGRDSAAEARMLEARGHLALKAGEHAEAVVSFEAAREASAAAGPRVRPGLHEALGRAYLALGDLSRSVSVLRVAYEDVTSDPADPILAVRFGGALAATYCEQGAFTEAERVLDDVLAHQAQIADPRAGAAAEGALARRYSEEGRFELAERLVGRVTDRLDQQAERRALGEAHVLCAQILLDRDEAAGALEHLDGAEPLIGDQAGQNGAILSVERARALSRLGQTAAARDAARLALDQAGNGDAAIAGSALTTLAELELADNNLDEARQLCRESIAAVEGVMAPHHLARTYEVLSRVEEAAGDLQAALEAARMAADRRALRT